MAGSMPGWAAAGEGPLLASRGRGTVEADRSEGRSLQACARWTSASGGPAEAAMLRLGRHLTRAVALATAALIPAAAAVSDGPPAAAEAAPGWGPIRVVGAGWRPAVTVDARGTTTVVWEDGGRIRAVRRAPAGTWTTPVVIGRGHSPEVGVDGRGSVTAIWQTTARGSPPACRPPGDRPVKAGRRPCT